MHRKSRERKMAGLSYHRNSNECWSSYGYLISTLLRTLSSILVLRIYYIDMLKKIMAGSSCETGRTSAYSEDIRWRMVYQRICLRKSYRDIAECLNVDSSTVRRTVALFEESGSVEKCKYPPNTGTTKLTDIGKLFVLEIAIDNPGIYLREIKQKLMEETGIDVNESTICRVLKDCGFTRQKMVLAAQQQNELLRAQYVSDISVYNSHPEFFIFVDEMGSDKTDRMRTFAYSLKGNPSIVKKLLWRGEHASAIVGMSSSKIIDFHIVSGSVTAETFDHFVIDALLPHLQPFNGINPHSVIVLDNASIHHSSDALALTEKAGSVVQFLPPYSPDFNPIEEAFSKVKSVLKANEKAWSNLDTETAVAAALNCITGEDCRSWCSHCGYN